MCKSDAKEKVLYKLKEEEKACASKFYWDSEYSSSMNNKNVVK